MNQRDKIALTIAALSEAIRYAVRYGGTVDSIRKSAMNIGRGMMLKSADIDAAGELFNWRKIDAALPPKPSMATVPANNQQAANGR